MNELNRTLEYRVEERTRELENTNTLLEDEIIQRDAMRRERETLIRQLEETVRTDALTGLKNRRHYFELGRTAVKKQFGQGRLCRPLCSMRITLKK